VAYFPERYGGKLVQLGMSVANREAVPPAVYTGHLLLTRANIDRAVGLYFAKTSELVE